MPLPPFRGFKIKFFRGLALGCSITAICNAPLAAQSVGESMLTAESAGRSPIVNDNLKLDQEIADDRARLPDLYSGSELDRDSKQAEKNIRSVKLTQSYPLLESFGL